MSKKQQKKEIPETPKTADLSESLGDMAASTDELDQHREATRARQSAQVCTPEACTGREAKGGSLFPPIPGQGEQNALGKRGGPTALSRQENISL